MDKIYIKMPLKVEEIIKKLNESGHEAYAVGGCVRDSILGRDPQDWDITTSANPIEVKKIFNKTYDTGIQHGTVTVLLDKDAFEVTTFRIDGVYEDNRRPLDVSFTKDVKEDLKRRDFNINAMAYHPQKGIIDPFNGQSDLKNKKISCVGSPIERFNEDALRMLRAVRFSAQLGFDIDNSTKEGIKECSHLIQAVSAERIRVELNKLLISSNPEIFLDLYEYELMKYIMPEFINCIGVEQNHPYHQYDVANHIIKTVQKSPKDPVIRWTMLLHDIGKPDSKTTDKKGIDHFHGHVTKSVNIASKILKRLKFDNKTYNEILMLIEYHDYRIEPRAKLVRRAMNKIGADMFLKYLDVQRADIQGQNKKMIKERLEMIDEIEKMFMEIKEKNQCVSMKDLQINGNDIKGMGISQGKEIGNILKYLLEKVIDNPSKNNKEELYNLIKYYINDK